MVEYVEPERVVLKYMFRVDDESVTVTAVHVPRVSWMAWGLDEVEEQLDPSYKLT